MLKGLATHTSADRDNTFTLGAGGFIRSFYLHCLLTGSLQACKVISINGPYAAVKQGVALDMPPRSQRPALTEAEVPAVDHRACCWSGTSTSQRHCGHLSLPPPLTLLPRCPNSASSMPLARAQTGQKVCETLELCICAACISVYQWSLCCLSAVGMGCVI